MIVEKDESSKIHHLADIEHSPKGTKLVLGKNSNIDSFVKIKPVGGQGNVTIGDYSFINSGTVIYSGNGVSIGNYVLIGPNCNLVPANHKFEDKNELIYRQRFMPSRGGIIIEDDVWLGACVTLLDGAHIAKGCVIGANTLIDFKTEEYGVYVGVPGKLVKKRT